MSVGQLVDQSTGQIYPLGFEPTSLGRQDDNAIVLPDPRVSRHHAEIAKQAGRWVVRDLGSANGTYVNGERIEGPRVLNLGDIIALGDATFLVEVDAPLTEQDTLVERLAPAAVAEPARQRSPWLAVGLGLAAVVAVVLVAALLVGALSGGADQTPTPLQPPATSVADATSVAAATPAEPAVSPTPQPPAAQATETPVPTVAPPTAAPTLPPPTAAQPAPTDPPVAEPLIGFFRAERTTIEPGACTRLEWGEVENANSLTLTGVGRVNFSGKMDVCLDATKAFTLKAAGTGGAAEITLQILVQPVAGPAIEYFRVVPSIIVPGDCAQLEWGKVEQAVSAVIEPDLGGVGTPDSATVCPGSTTTYVLTAENPEGTRTAQTTLVVSDVPEQKPVIPFFTANPTSIQAGECTTLSWGKVDYAAFVSIDQNVGGIGTPGEREICPGVTTTYLMTAVGLAGITESTLTVSVSEGQLAELPELVVESILFDPNPCYRGQKCKVRVKVRNDGPVDAGHLVVRWAPAGEEAVPVEWDVDFLAAGQETELSYPWIPNRAEEQWFTVAVVDLNDEIAEIEEGTGNTLEQDVEVREQ